MIFFFFSCRAGLFVHFFLSAKEIQLPSALADGSRRRQSSLPSPSLLHHACSVIRNDRVREGPGVGDSCVQQREKD